MTRPGELCPQVYAFATLLRAFRKARRGKRQHPEVADFTWRLEEHLLTLQDELRSGTYTPGLYQHFWVSEPKRRKISAAPFRDRVVHHALVGVLEPLFEPRFIADSYACRRGKGTHRAVARCLGWVRGYPYVLRGDVRKFFPSVDHEILLRRLARVISDQAVLALCARILASGAGVLEDEYPQQWFPGDNLFAVLRPRGLPIGNLTSQFWGNVYLDMLDHFVKRELRCRAYLRYGDDFALFAQDRATLHHWREAVVAHLASLRLTAHERQLIVRPTRCGVPFLGFWLFPRRIRLRREAVQRAARRLRWLRRAYQNGVVGPAQVSASIQAWVAHCAYARSLGLRRALLGGARFVRFSEG
ncbi:MAG: group II intron reverse transcriptase domain-containing protein [Deinococcus sp.]|nr:group II intron reverse transcriptase domain-containing protein [Deinococcus sp.]